MAPLLLKIMQENRERTVKFDSSGKLVNFYNIIKETAPDIDDGKEYALFLRSADDDQGGALLECDRPLDYNMLRKLLSLYYKSTKTMEESPVVRVKLNEEEFKGLQGLQARKLSAVNFYVARLIDIKFNRNNPDNFVNAEKAVEMAYSLMPGIKNDSLSLARDDDSHVTMIHLIADWCDALRAVCASARDEDPAKFVDSTQHFADTSDKLRFMFGLSEVSPKGQQVMQLSENACNIAKQMASDSIETAHELPAALAVDVIVVIVRANELKDAASALRTTAQLLTPCIEEAAMSQTLLLFNERVGTIARHLVSHTAEHTDLRCKDLGTKLVNKKADLDKALDGIEDACYNEEVKKMQFRCSVESAQTKAMEVVKLLDQPPSEVQLTEQDKNDLQEKLSKVMEQINADLAYVIDAASLPEDQREEHFVEAKKFFINITELLPEIVNDAKHLSVSCKDDETRKAMFDDVRAWCVAIQDVCASAASDEALGFSDATVQFSNASQKLRFVNSARKTPAKEQRIMQLASSACDKAKQMVDETHRVESAVGGFEADILLRAVVLSNSAIELHTIAQELVRYIAQAKQPEARRLSEEVDRYSRIMDSTLSSLVNVFAMEDIQEVSPGTEFITSANNAETKAKEVEKLLDEPPSEVQLTEQGENDLQEELSKAVM